jgi:hypothetical protein
MTSASPASPFQAGFFLVETPAQIKDRSDGTGTCALRSSIKAVAFPGTSRDLGEKAH